MALIAHPPTCAEAEHLAAKLLEQLDDDAFQGAFFADLEQQVASFEQQYGLRSEDVGPAINAGPFVETHEVCQWLLDYKSLVRLGARTGTAGTNSATTSSSMNARYRLLSMRASLCLTGYMQSSPEIARIGLQRSQ